MKPKSATRAPTPGAQAIEDLVAASRILAAQGVLDAYGHVSMRHPRRPDRYLMSRSRAPELVEASDIIELDLDSTPVGTDRPALFIERFIHGEIYRSRSDVHAVVHSHSPSVIPFGATGVPMRPIFHMSAFLHVGVPVFEIREAAGMTDLLVRTPDLGKALADRLGERPVALMRGHGNVVVAPSIPLAVFRAIYTECNARLQMQALALGGTITYLAHEEGRLAEASIAGTVARPWELWKRQALGG